MIKSKIILNSQATEQYFLKYIIQMQQTQLKTELYKNIQTSGLLEELKKHLRIQLCERLKEKDLVQKQGQSDDRLYSRIFASLISEQLRISSCTYTQSVYVAEGGYDGKVLSRNEILEVMGMEDVDLDPVQSILSNILRRKYPFNGCTVRNFSVQTSPEEIGYTLEQRLTLIDQQYKANLSNNPRNVELEELKDKYQKRESQLKRELEKDLERFKQFQIHSVKVQVSQDWRKKFESYAKKLQADYTRKIEGIRRKEKLLEEDYVHKQKNLDEKSSYLHKNLTDKHQVLDLKSLTIQEQMKNLSQEQALNKASFQAQSKQLKEKIKQYDDLLLDINKKITYEVNVAKLSMQQEYHEKQVQFQRRKKFVDEEYSKLMSIKETTDIIKSENERLFQDNKQLREELTKIEQQYRISISQNGNKNDRIDNLKQEMFALEQKLASIMEKEKKQEKRRKRNEQQIIKLRNQIEQLRDWKQQHEPSSSNIDIEGENKPTSQLEHKLEQIKLERKKDIQKFRLNL